MQKKSTAGNLASFRNLKDENNVSFHSYTPTKKIGTPMLGIRLRLFCLSQKTSSSLVINCL